MKINKIFIYIIAFVALSGCVQSTAMVGPAITMASTGNFTQAGLSYFTNRAVEEETGMDTVSFVSNKIEKQNLEAVYGSRVLKIGKFKNIQNFSHRIRIYGNIFLTFISNLINNQKLTDAHTCYKLIRSSTFKKIDLKENGFSFCPEVTTKLSLLKIDIGEVPINYKGRTYEEGKKIVAYDGIRAISTLFKYRFFT